MAIKYFVFIMFIVSSFSLFISIDKKKEATVREDKPIMIFDKSVLYTINSQEIQRIVDSKKTLIYNKKEESYDSKVVLKTTENGIVDTLVSDYTLKIDNKISFLVM
jgi:aromatic ring-opening dioxygenase LigB subunit